jgi:hypothetical protein
MTENDDEIHGLLGVLSQALAKSKDTFRFDARRAEDNRSVIKIEAPPAPAALETPPFREGRLPEPIVQMALEKSRILSVDETQAIILQGLRQIPDFPERGVAVTVYGFRPWNAMLSFAPGATSHEKAIVFRQALYEIVQKLRETIQVDIQSE